MENVIILNLLVKKLKRRKSDLNEFQMRNYNEIALRIKSFGGEEIGYVGKTRQKFPLYKLKKGQGKKILLSAGVHGDEPAGVYALLEFLHHNISEYEKNFEFTIFPCINPWGFENDDRTNGQAIDLNREFSKSFFDKRIFLNKVKENFLIFPHLDQYYFAMDLHETSESWANDFDPCTPGQFYLWETCEDKSKRIGQEIIKRVEKQGIIICKWPIINKEKNNGGIIWYPENCTNPDYIDGTNFEAYLTKYHTRHSFTIETPIKLDLEQRVQAHITSIITALENIK